MSAGAALVAVEDTGDVTAGPIALLIVVVLAVVVVLLVRSMGTRMRNVQRNAETGQWQGYGDRQGDGDRQGYGDRHGRGVPAAAPDGPPPATAAEPAAVAAPGETGESVEPVELPVEPGHAEPTASEAAPTDGAEDPGVTR